MPEKIIRILQISDSHLFADENGTLLQLNTRRTYDAVIKQIQQESLSLDLILLTGDLSHDGSTESYHYLAKQLKSFKCPIYWLPGNHDALPTIKQALGTTHLRSDKEIKIENWHFLLLNSVIPGKPSGYLEQSELDKVNHFIKTSKHDHLVILLHHQPIPVGSTWLDGVGLKNPAELLALVKECPRVRAVIFGHVHQSFDEMSDGIRYIAVPSTSIQFLPKSAHFALDPQPPGYQYLEFYSDGTIKPIVHRLKEFHEKIDFSAEGY